MSLRIELSGPEGNAFYLMAMANDLGRQLGLNKDEINKIIGEMKSSHYDNLVKVFIEKFGTVVRVYKNGILYNCESCHADE